MKIRRLHCRWQYDAAAAIYICVQRAESRRVFYLRVQPSRWSLFYLGLERPRQVFHLDQTFSCGRQRFWFLRETKTDVPVPKIARTKEA